LKRKILKFDNWLLWHKIPGYSFLQARKLIKYFNIHPDRIY
jgi:hypothetical protein